MGQFLNRFKYRRDCNKCRLIDIETDDIFDDEPLPYIGTIKQRRIYNEHMTNRIMTNKRYIYNLYKQAQSRANK